MRTILSDCQKTCNYVEIQNRRYDFFLQKCHVTNFFKIINQN